MYDITVSPVILNYQAVKYRKVDLCEGYIETMHFKDNCHKIYLTVQWSRINN